MHCLKRFFSQNDQQQFASSLIPKKMCNFESPLNQFHLSCLIKVHWSHIPASCSMKKLRIASRFMLGMKHLLKQDTKCIHSTIHISFQNSALFNFRFFLVLEPDPGTRDCPVRHSPTGHNSMPPSWSFHHP